MNFLLKKKVQFFAPSVGVGVSVTAQSVLSPALLLKNELPSFLCCMNFGLIVFLFLEDFLPPESLYWAALSTFRTG